MGSSRDADRLEEEDPLVPGMPPMLTRVLAVGGDTARLDLLVTNLRLRGYEVTGSTDPAAAMAGLRQDGLQVFSSDVVMVDRSSEYPGGLRAAEKLLEFAIREPLLCAYMIEGKDTFGPLEMEDLDAFMKPIIRIESNGPKSPMATLNGRRARRSNKPTCGIDSREVEHDGYHVEKEQQQQPNEKPKKSRIIWTDELHNKFLEAYAQIIDDGGDVVPTKILKLMRDSMNDCNLTREHIASHLQKHRLNLQRESCIDPVRRSQSRVKHHTSTPQAAFPSHNKASKQKAPPTIVQPDLSVYINCGMSAHTMIEASTKSDMQDNCVVIHMQTFKATDKSNESVLVDVPPKDMYPGADDPKQNSCVGNSVENSPHEDLCVILNNEPEPSWDNKFLFADSD